jgi:hypothetical protein
MCSEKKHCIDWFHDLFWSKSYTKFVQRCKGELRSRLRRIICHHLYRIEQRLLNVVSSCMAWWVPQANQIRKTLLLVDVIKKTHSNLWHKRFESYSSPFRPKPMRLTEKELKKELDKLNINPIAYQLQPRRLWKFRWNQFESPKRTAVDLSIDVTSSIPTFAAWSTTPSSPKMPCQ